MRAELYGHNVRLSPAARAHVERRVRFALGRLAVRVGRVRVGFSKPAGRRRAARQCRMIVDLLRAGRVVIEHRAARWGEAVAGAAGRLAAAVRRRLARRHLGRRRPPRPRRKEV
jgi:hypothetical protein